MDRIRVDVDPLAARFMQEEIRRDWSDACTCKIADDAGECYRGKTMYVFETPEESGTAFGYGTSTIHAKCGRPVYLDAEQRRAAGRIPSYREFFNR